MGLFTKSRSDFTPPVSAEPSPQEILDRLGLTRDQFAAKAVQNPAMGQVLALADAIDQVGAYLTAGYIVAGPNTEEGKEALASAGLILLVAGNLAGGILEEIKNTLEAASV